VLRVGIIGAGYGCAVHLPAFNDQPGVRVVAISDGGSGHGARFCEDGPVYYSDWRELLEARRADAVVVATPPNTQIPITARALETGHHVLCEKPFGMNFPEAEAMTRCHHPEDAVGAVGFQFRFSPHIQRMRRLVTDSAFGPLLAVEVSWLTSGRADPQRLWSWQNDAGQGGGVINAFVSHLADLVAWITGTPLKKVRSAATKIEIPSRPAADGSSRAVTAEDYVAAEFELDGGVPGRLEVGNCVPQGSGMTLRVTGNDGELVFRSRPPFRWDDQNLAWRKPGGRREDIPVPGPAVRNGADSRLTEGRSLAAAFCGAVAGRTGSRVDGLPGLEAGLAARKFIDGLHRATGTGT